MRVMRTHRNGLRGGLSGSIRPRCTGTGRQACERLDRRRLYHPELGYEDHLGDGYNFNFGVQVNVTPVIGIEGLYSFNGLGEKRISIPVSMTSRRTPVPTDFFGSMNMQYGTANVVFQRPHGGSGRTASSAWASTTGRSR